MNLQTFLAALRVPRLWAQLQIRRDAATFFRLHFLYAALDAGLLAALRTPRSKAELIRLLQVRRPELLDRYSEIGIVPVIFGTYFIGDSCPGPSSMPAETQAGLMT